MTKYLIGRLLKACHQNNSGNFGLMFSLLLAPLLIGLGASIDFAIAYNVQSKMQTDLDSALLSAVGEVGIGDETAIKSQIKGWFKAQGTMNYIVKDDDISIVADRDTLGAKITANVETSFMLIAGITSIPVTGTSAVKGGQSAAGAISLYFVVDRSHSMNEAINTSYNFECSQPKTARKQCANNDTKMESLKIAVADFSTRMNIIDPAEQYRTGAIAYNTASQTPYELAFGSEGVVNYINALTPVGAANSVTALKTAYERLMSTSEEKAHKGLVVQKAIIFISGSENVTTAADTDTKAWCDRARAAKITIYGVAFDRASRGQALAKYCATSPDGFFGAESTDDMITAFQIIASRLTQQSVRLIN